jgi:DNA-binding PadR family transcriptional regulator
LKPDLKLTIQKRSLKAFLDLALLCALANQPLTAYGINGLFMNKLGIMVSPSMIYTNLFLMERKGLIKCIRNGAGRTYALTEQGKEIADNINGLTDQIRTFTFNLQKLKTNL